jgi:hypothetical protein
MIGALVFANPGRPVAARRRRSRTARTTGKEKVMARSRTRRRGRRRTLRNAKGHFVARSRTRRSRRRRNPSGYIKVGRRWKKITKFARRRRRGSRRGQIRGFKFPRRYRRSRSRRRVRSNPVVVSNPRRSRRRVRRNPYRSRRRYARRNPAASFRLASDPIGAIKNAIMSAFSMDTVETLAHMGVGFGGSLWLSKLITNASWTPTTPQTMPYWKVGSTFLSSVLLAGASSLLKNSRLTARVLTGGLFATLWTAVSEAVSGTQFQQYIPTLSGAENEEFRKAIEAEVLKELRGGGVHGYLPAAGAEGFETYLRPAGIEYLRPAGSEAYLTEVNAQRAQSGMGAYLTERNATAAEAGVGNDADDEFSRRGMPERF